MSNWPRAINVNWPVLALLHDLGMISSTPSPVVTAAGFLRSSAVSLIDLPQFKQDRFLHCETATSVAITLDVSLISAENSAVPGAALANIISLATGQAMTNTE
ncbi:hypothetical protein K488DRAFT_82231 [Vararia minispora EC-137]|uniref:Uncharacterized protein n=1 Tax=Vararia minispora EC-137 TaxID=1314806 RepID=A0ACB8QWK3_9AGAM|nr:hypothetical protein K488DRAFT_82231 [Vararia minispora EC-137]